MQDFIIPKVGMGITEVVIIEWKVKTGDRVKEGDPVVEIDAEKADVVLEAKVPGVVAEILYQNDDPAEVGSVICRINEDFNEDLHT
jgi:pyruvate/2-oxoglutarate dehydrogenase complex dihydrolipoamide acyltransferase (E2) component